MRQFSIPVEVISEAIFSAHVYPIKNFVILLNEGEINSSESGKKVTRIQGPYKIFRRKRIKSNQRFVSLILERNIPFDDEIENRYGFYKLIQNTTLVTIGYIHSCKKLIIFYKSARRIKSLGFSLRFRHLLKIARHTIA